MARPRLTHIALPGLLLALVQPWQVEARPAGRSRTAGDRAERIATQPLRDLNMMRATVPEKLRAIQADPYDARRLETCTAISQEVATLDTLLPPDVDHPGHDADLRGVGETLIDVGGDMIVGIMPFRGVVRAVSGASAAEARRRYALHVGEARRSFLKGLGLARGCAPPAAPGTPAIIYEFGL